VHEYALTSAADIVPVFAEIESKTMASSALQSASSPAAMKAPVTAPSLMPPPMLPVVRPSNGQVFYKQIRDINFADFSVESHLSVRFSKSSEKLFFCDMLVQLGTHKTIAEAHDAIMLLVNAKDIKMNDLNSLEVNDEVLSNGKSVILMSCPDAIKLLKLLGMCTFVGRTPVYSKDASLYGKKMRDVHMAGFSVGSDAIIRCCSRDHSVSVADMLVGIGRFASYKYANQILLQMIKRKDKKFHGLNTLVEDKTKFDTVSTLLLDKIYSNS